MTPEPQHGGMSGAVRRLPPPFLEWLHQTGMNPEAYTQLPAQARLGVWYQFEHASKDATPRATSQVTLTAVAMALPAARRLEVIRSQAEINDARVRLARLEGIPSHGPNPARDAEVARLNQRIDRIKATYGSMIS